jgi:serine protease Do
MFTGVTRMFDYIWPTSSGSTAQIGNTTPGNITFTSGSAIASSSDVSGIVDNVMPSIVSITQKYTQKGYSVFGQYVEKNATGSGSGFIVKQDKNELLVVTNNHVVAGANKISVTFIDQTVVDATVKGTDSTADLAVLSVKLNAIKSDTLKKIKVASLGESDNTKVGQMAIAIGNALGYGQSVTVGYISAKDRKVSVQNENSGKANTMTLLQTDAAINPGNSGGPLLDATGRVIGINSVKYASSEVEGMGYAIPMSKAVPIINELMKREVLSESEKGYLGITGRTISETMSQQYGIPVGAYVVDVAKDGAAGTAGIQKGDVITKVNGKEVTDIQQVVSYVNSYRIGTQIKITVKRSENGGYKEKVFTVKLKGVGTTSGLDTGDSTTKNKDNQNNNLPEQDPEDDDSSQFPWGNDY